MLKAGYLGKREFDEFELAWTNFNCKCKMVRFSDIGNMSGFDGKLKIDYTMPAKIHPTQKHVNIYNWILKEFAQKGMKILDTHLGSANIAIACHYFGVELTGCEIDKQIYLKAVKNYETNTVQTKLF